MLSRLAHFVVAITKVIAEAERTSILEQEMKKDEIQRDYKIAQELQHKYNAEGNIPGEFPASGDAQRHPSSARSERSAGSGGVFSRGSERDLDKANKKIASLQKKLGEMQDAAVHWQSEAHANHKASVNYYNQARQLDMELRSAVKHIHYLEGELKGAKNELSGVKQQLSDAVNLSEVRGKELKGAQVFLTKADTLSVTDVIQKVGALNEEIFQMAAFLGEVLVYEVYGEGEDRATSRTQAINGFFARAEKMLGTQLATALAQESIAEPREPSNPLLVQIVMQIALTQWCAFMGSRWTSYQKRDSEPSSEGEDQAAKLKDNKTKQTEHNNLLSDLYNNIRDHGECSEESILLDV